MVTLSLLAAWVWVNVPHWLLFLIPVAMLVLDIGHFNQKWFPQRDDYQAQITKASHGAAFIVLAPLVTIFIFHDRLRHDLPDEWLPWVWPITYAIMALGLWWLIIGWSRTMSNRRDMNLIVRAIVKGAAGMALFFALTHNLLLEADWPLPYKAYANVAIFWLSIWLVVTAITRLVLLMKKMRTMQNMHARPQERFFQGWHWE
jgi:hypothetical protein